MISTKREIRAQIERLTESISDQELFSSPAYQDLLRSSLRAATEHLPRKIDLVCTCDPGDNMTASSCQTRNGYTVRLNTLGPTIRNLPSRRDRYYSCLGLITHEAGHILFTDFPAHDKYMTALRAHHWYPKSPPGAYSSEITDRMVRDPRFAAYFTEIARSLYNIVEDSYIENRMYELFDGVLILGLEKTNDELYSSCASLESRIKAHLAGKIQLVTVIMEMILPLALGYDIPRDGNTLADKEKQIQDQILNTIRELDVYISKLRYESDTRKKAMMLNEMLCILYPLMPPEEKKPESRKQESGSDPDSEESAQDSPDQGQDENHSGQDQTETGSPADASGESSDRSASPSSGSSELERGEKEIRAFRNTLQAMPQGKSRPVSKDPMDPESVNQARDKAGALSGSDKIMQRGAERMMETVLGEIAREKTERRRTADLSAEAAMIRMKVAPGSDWIYNVNRPIPADPELYNHRYERLSGIVRSSARKLNSVLNERRKQDGKISGYYYGGTLDMGCCMRDDDACFSRESVPTGDPDLAVALLIDESGSMRDRDKYSYATDTAIVLDDILRKINVPALIIGHKTGCSCVNGARRMTSTTDLNIYREFDEIDNKDRYRLSWIDASSSNRDSAAIAYCAERLLQRPEVRKLLIVISDGIPSSLGVYSSAEDPVQDAAMTVKAYRKRDIHIIGAIIDDGTDRIKEIYGENHSLDLSDLNNMTPELVRVIKRYVLK